MKIASEEMYFILLWIVMKAIKFKSLLLKK
jgi:hypothetical protein